MKYTIVSVIGLMASLSVANAAVSVGVKNFNNSTAGFAFVDNTGAGIVPSFGVGFFDVLTADFQGDPAALYAAFDQNGTDRTGVTTQPGMMNTSVGDAATSTDGSDGYTGKTIYVLVGNNSAGLADSTDFVAFASTQTWPAEAEGIGATATVNMFEEYNANKVQLLRGIEGPANLTGAFAGITQGIQFGVIPEPSTSLLAGLAGLTLLIRRRR